MLRLCLTRGASLAKLTAPSTTGSYAHGNRTISAVQFRRFGPFPDRHHEQDHSVLCRQRLRADGPTALLPASRARCDREHTKSYKRVTSIANDARLAGLMDWDAIEDRTRSFVRRQRWENGKHLMNAAANSYHIDMWKRQARRVFVIIEKEALVGVLTPTCNKLDSPILAARGYPSCTVLRDFAIEDILPSV